MINSNSSSQKILWIHNIFKNISIFILLLLAIFLAWCNNNTNPQTETWTVSTWMQTGTQNVAAVDSWNMYTWSSATWWIVTWNQASWTTQTWTQATNSKTYTNDKYWFSIDYPSTATIKDSFDIFYLLGNKWSANENINTTWQSIVSIITSEIKQENSFPRYYSSQLRIWLSKDSTDIKNCTNLPNSQSLTWKSIGWQKFAAYSLDDAAMMQYMWWISYRIIHNNTCFVIEKIKIWSSYQDETQTNNISQKTLDDYFAELDPIIDSFKFTR